VNDKKRQKYYLVLSVLLWVVILSIYVWWFVADKAIVEFWDGQSQHFTSFVYYGEYVREVFKNIIFAHDFQLPQYDFSIGYGQDILGTLHYYIIGDPFSILSVFTKPKYAEFVFAFAIMLRVYLAGISFSVFSLSKKFGYFQSFIGTFVYTFSGFAISAASRHPYFINPMIYLPLLCLAVDNMFERKGYKLFIFMTFIAVISNFYYFYMLTILVFVYAIYRYLELYSIKNVKQLLNLFIRSIASYLIGVLMGAAIFLPVVFQFLNAGRSSVGPVTENLYSKQFYLNFVKNFISPVYGAEVWTVTAYIPIVILVFAYMFSKIYRGDKSVKQDLITIVSLTLLLMVPYVGSLFNGFSYSSNRWIFGYSFFVAFFTAKYLPNIIISREVQAERKQLSKISYITLILSFILILSNFKREVKPFVGIIFLLIYLILLLIPKDIKITKILFSVAIVLNVLVYGAFHTNIKINHGIFKDYTDKNIVKNDYWAYKSSVAKDIQNSDKNWFRYELSQENYRAEINNAIIRNTNSTNFYFSLSNKNVFSFNRNVGNNIRSDFEYYGLDSRAELGTLANSKYYIKESTTSSKTIPFGYTYHETIQKGGKDIEVYKNDNSLPFGYTYDSYCIVDDSQRLPLEYADSMTRSVLVDTEVPGLNSTKLSKDNTKKIDFKIASTKGIKIEENKYIVSEPNGEVVFQLDKPSVDPVNEYLFINIDGIDFPNMNHGIFGIKGDMTETNIEVAYGNLNKNFSYRNQYQSWYAGIDNVVLNLGAKKDNEVKLTFQKKGIYSFKSIEMFTRDYSDFSSDISKLREDTLENVIFGTDSIKGNINLNEEKMLLLTIPYDSGWSAYDNGKKIPIVKSNFMWSGLVLKKGDHQIYLKYETPGLKIGIIISIIGWSVFIILVWREKKRRKFEITAKNKKTL
jgi:uncharacterized membrane protein YfhO